MEIYNDTIRQLFGRRSVRSFEEKEILPEVKEAILLSAAFSLAHCTIPFEASTWQTFAPAFIQASVAQPV